MSIGKTRGFLYWLSGRPPTLDGMVFANIDGRPIHTGVLSHNFGGIVRQAGLGRVRFHDLRHTFASLMLLCGTKPVELSLKLSRRRYVIRTWPLRWTPIRI